MQRNGSLTTNPVQRAASGIVLAAFGIAMLVIGWNYPAGRLSQMGPGFVPLSVGVLICVLAATILWTDLRDATIGPAEAPHLRGLVFVSTAILVFAGLVEIAGLLPSMFLSVAVSKLADRENRPLGILVYSTLATLVGWLLFLVVLELPIPAFWR